MLKRYLTLLSLFIFSMLFLNLACSASPVEGKRIAASEAHSLFIDPSGTVWLWGGADEKHPERYRPRPILNKGKFVFTGMDSNNAFIIRQNESLWGLGRSNFVQLGSIQPSGYSATQPVQVLPDQLPQVRSLNANTDTIFAIKPDGTLWTWGDHQYGQLGDGTLTNRDEPHQVIFPK